MRREESEGLGGVFGEIHELLRARAGLTPHEALEVVLVALELLDSSRIANIKRADSGSDLRTKFLTRAPSIDRDVADAVLTSFERSGWLEMNRELRGPALLHFIPPELRRGLGIFFTPEPLAQALSRAFRLRDGLRIFDPACGAGVLLRDFALRASKEKRRIELFGGEINPALLRLASLHLGSIDPGFRGIRHDALREDQKAERVIPKGSVDLLISNPPYGILLDSSDPALAQFHLARFVKSRLPFELLFIERALGWLSPGGHAALILPRSILTNRGFEEARAALDRVLIPEALISLPAETFAGAGASVSPIVLFFRRRDPRVDAPRDVPHALIQNIGLDRSGRFIEGSELEALGNALEALFQNGEIRRPFERLEFGEAASLSGLSRALFAGAKRASAPAKMMSSLSGAAHRLPSNVPLGELVSLANTGKTPPRSAYQEEGAFILKVGNLTDEGIDFSPRERNFIAPDRITPRLRLEPGDLLLTSTAHHPKYIAQKVDLFVGTPWVSSSPISFVGELMRLRPRLDRIDPLALLAILRHHETRERIRMRIHGQTAHLRPRDLLGVEIDETLATKERILALKEELELSRKRNELRFRMRALYDGR